VLGVGVASGLIVSTRQLVARAAWARALGEDLRPAVVGATNTEILVLALASGIGEELLFRGLAARALVVTPAAHGLDGVVLSSIGFGLLHQMRGRARWAWAAWAGTAGLLFGLVAWATESLVGPMIAHALVNLANLRFLRDLRARDA
jgi:membrane protease YdiL (CAAX protease family)